MINQQKRKTHSLGEFPQPNKILKNKQLQTNNSILKAHLRDIKPRIDNSFPITGTIFKNRSLNKAKGVQTILLDQDHIKKENAMLFVKIQAIHDKSNKPKTSHVSTYKYKQTQRQKKMNETRFLEKHQLDEENFKMSQRLLNTRSVFNVKQIEKETMNYYKIRQPTKLVQNYNNNQNNDNTNNWLESNVTNSLNVNSKNFSELFPSQQSTIKENGIYRKDQYYKLINRDDEQEKIVSKPVLVDNEPYYADIKIDNDVFMIELTDLQDRKFFHHIQGKLGRRLFFVECSGNIEHFVNKLRVDKQNNRIYFSKSLLPFQNLQPIKPLKVTYTAHLTNRPPLYQSTKYKVSSPNNEESLDIGRSRGFFPKTTKSSQSISQKFHNQKIPSRFEFVSGMGKNQQKGDLKTQKDERKKTDRYSDNYDDDYYDDEFEDNNENKQQQNKKKTEEEDDDKYEDEFENDNENNNNNENDKQKTQDKKEEPEQDEYEEEYEENNDDKKNKENAEKNQEQDKQNDNNNIQEEENYEEEFDQEDEKPQQKEEKEEKQENKQQLQQEEKVEDEQLEEDNYEEEFEDKEEDKPKKQEELEEKPVKKDVEVEDQEEKYDEDDYEEDIQEDEKVEEKQEQQQQKKEEKKPTGEVEEEEENYSDNFDDEEE